MDPGLSQHEGMVVYRWKTLRSLPYWQLAARAPHCIPLNALTQRHRREEKLMKGKYGKNEDGNDENARE